MNIRNILKTGPGLLTIVALAAGTAGQAQAASVTGPDIRVQFQRSSLDTFEGATTLLKRIETAAVRVCATFDHADVATRARRKDCRRTLTQTAVNEVNHPLLLAAYGSRHQPRRLFAVTR